MGFSSELLPPQFTLLSSVFFFYNTSLLCSLGLPRTNNLAKDVLKLLISLLQLRMAVIKAWTVHLALQINVSSFSFLPSQADLFHCAHISHSHMLTIIGFLRQGHEGNMHMHTVAILTNSTQRERVGEIRTNHLQLVLALEIETLSAIDP